MTTKRRRTPHATPVPMFRTVACRGCGICCTEPVVPVTDSDVRRIARALDAVPADFVKFYTDNDMDFAPDCGVWIRFPHGKRAMGLRRRKNRCIFLGNDRRCAIYRHRPMTCRTFPYQADLDESGALKRATMNPIVSCMSRRVADSPLTQLVQDTLVEDREDAKYYRLIEKWNAAPGKRERDFLELLQKKWRARNKEKQ